MQIRCDNCGQHIDERTLLKLKLLKENKSKVADVYSRSNITYAFWLGVFIGIIGTIIASIINWMVL